jgi:hypothetical protein
MIAANYTIQLMTTLDEFKAYKASWLSFEETIEEMPITGCYHYLFAFWSHFLKMKEKNILDKELAIALLLKDGQVKAIFPFCIITRKRKFFFSVRSLEFIGQQLFSCFSDVITESISQEEFKLVIEKIYQSYKIDVMCLSHITKTSKAYNAGYEKNYRFNLCYRYDLTAFPDYKHYSAVYAASHKQNIRTAKNRIERDGLTYEEFSRPITEIDMQEIMRLSASKLRDGKSDVYSDGAKLALSKDLYAVFNARVLYIALNGKPVAYRTNLYYRNEKFCFDASFDRDYKKYSVGMLSVEANLKDSFLHGYREHSEGWGEDVYKERFSTGFDALYAKIGKGNRLLAPYWFKKYSQSYTKQA